MNSKINSIDAYIATFPADVQAILQAIRATIKTAAPDAQEKISYQMPAFAQNGNLVYFAAWKSHIGLYVPNGAARDAFKDELAGFVQTKGSIHFPLDQPMPLKLISDIVQFRVAQNLKKAEKKP